jgi:5-hydroxyisourate hydrolase
LRAHFPHPGTFAGMRAPASKEQSMAGSGRLTTHVLDTANGRPAAGMRFDLLMVHGDHSHHMLAGETNLDGRTDGPLLEGDRFHLGTYELVFHVGDYFERLNTAIEHQFLDYVPVRFSMGAVAHYHVPLLVSPYSYSTYRGS